MYSFLKRNPLFRKYWISTWLSELGDWLRNMALMYAVLDLFHKSSVAMSYIMFVEYAPIFLFAPLVGVFADRWNRKRTIIAANWYRAGMVMLLLEAVWFGPSWVIFLGAFLSAVGTLFFRAPGNAYTMQFVPEEDRKTAASLRQISSSVMILIGPVVGTSIYMFLGVQWSFLITILLFVISAVLIKTILTSEIIERKGLSIYSVWSDLLTGIRYAFKHTTVRPILISAMFVGFGAGLIQVLEIFIITDFLELPQTIIAVLGSIQGGGMLVSAFLVQRSKLSADQLITYGMIVMGIGLGLMVLYPNLAITAAGILVFSLGQISLNVGIATLMQTKVQYTYQGRVQMTFHSALMGALTVALLVSGWMYQFIPLRALVISGGVIIILGGLLSSWLFSYGQHTELAEHSV
ncbi:MFS transporter [Paenibacillus alba]|uniref:MFS transporter n=1 Tax=Paenibacillus alba TaxID=1197127 RepID=UPI0015638C1A|nr:MFS transporter [Paenibacillus alba]